MALTLGEGGKATFTVVLDARPSADVILVVGADTRDIPFSPDVSVSPTRLTFTRVNWFTPQTVTVRAEQDGDSENDFAQLGFQIEPTGDYGEYLANSSTLIDEGVHVTVIDDDLPPGVTLSESRVFYSLDDLNLIANGIDREFHVESIVEGVWLTNTVPFITQAERPSVAEAAVSYVPHRIFRGGHWEVIPNGTRLDTHRDVFTKFLAAVGINRVVAERTAGRIVYDRSNRPDGHSDRCIGPGRILVVVTNDSSTQWRYRFIPVLHPDYDLLKTGLQC